MMVDKKQLGVIFSILFIGILARCINITHSFWLDEAAQALESSRPLSQQFNIIPDFQPPLYHLIVHFFAKGNHHEWWLRLVSVIPGILSIWLTFVIAKKWFSFETASLAAILLATSQFHTFYSQELRPYSLATLCALVVVVGYQHIKAHQRGGWWWFIIGSIAGIYSTYVFPFFLIAMIGLMIGEKISLKQLAGATLLIAASFVPWVPTFTQQLQVGTSLAQTSTVWSQMVSPPMLKMLPLTAAKFMFGRIPLKSDIRQIIYFGIVGFLMVIACFRGLSKKSLPIIIWLCVPIMLAWIVSIKIPILDPKRVLFCLPALYILIAQGIKKDTYSIVSLALIFSVQMYGLNLYATNPDIDREQWRQAVTTIEQQTVPNAAALFVFPESFAPWRWYQTNKVPSVAVSASNFSTESVSPYTTIYYFDYLTDMTDPERTVLTTLNQSYQETSFLQYPGVGKIRVLTK
jgi:uncharacterized membrane protein